VFFAHLVWAAERHQNSEQFPPNYLSGIDDAMWWVLVTFTTVGYGDKVPCTPAGKIVAGVWMILALAQSSILIGRTSSRFDDVSDATPFHSVDELGGKRVCSYPSSLASWYMDQSVPYVPVPGENINDCGLKLQMDEADAVIMEKPMIAYWMRSNEWARNAPLLVGGPIATVPMGLIFPPNSSLVDVVNERMLHMFESDLHRTIKGRWLKLPDRVNPDDVIQWPIVGTAMAVALFYGALQLAPRRWRATAENAGMNAATSFHRKTSVTTSALQQAVSPKESVVRVTSSFRDAAAVTSSTPQQAVDPQSIRT